MKAGQNRSGDAVLFAIVSIAAIFAVLWISGVASALVSGHPVPRVNAFGAIVALANINNPSVAWGAPVGPPVVYWLITTLIVGIVCALGYLLFRFWMRDRDRAAARSSGGLATRSHIKQAAGSDRVARLGNVSRPSLDRPSAREVGYCLGRSHGIPCWTSVEDSLILVGPPRSGKGLHMVIPAILDSPGAVITTSTRPDNLAISMQARERIGPVAVFDPERLTCLPASTRWSPIRGCELPRVAMARSRALCVDPATGVEGASFWSQQCSTAVRCLLHAAALEGRPPAELLRWSLSALVAQDALDILCAHPNAAPAWDSALEAILAADPRQRDSIWSMVANVFAPLADPTVLEAVSPDEGEAFDPVRFLDARGTLYLLGTASGASATATLVAAFVEDVVETARHQAAVSKGARLDPPLALILDEAANYPLPSLPSLMSEGGGTGITTMVVLQSLAQARRQWGTDGAAAIWDAAIVKVILGGSGNANDLRDLSALIGSREDRRYNESWGPDGRRSTSISTQEVPILDTGRLRTLPFGQGILLLRSALPIALDLQPWTARPDASGLQRSRTHVEGQLRGPSTNTSVA
jgi:type IV secretion system protein VirD4